MNQIKDLLKQNEVKETNLNPSNIPKMINSISELEYGECCFCKEECNPHSQACGRCMRNGPINFDS
uniref:Uncharacterized protein n=1 Tax=viral metagenome TaxID=1070528 RepID=A0A6C0LSU0_9ZZZZ